MFTYSNLRPGSNSSSLSIWIIGFQACKAGTLQPSTAPLSPLAARPRPHLRLPPQRRKRVPPAPAPRSAPRWRPPWPGMTDPRPTPTPWPRSHRRRHRRLAGLEAGWVFRVRGAGRAALPSRRDSAYDSSRADSGALVLVRSPDPGPPSAGVDAPAFPRDQSHSAVQGPGSRRLPRGVICPPSPTLRQNPEEECFKSPPLTAQT